MSRQKKSPVSVAAGTGAGSKTDSLTCQNNTTNTAQTQAFSAPFDWEKSERERQRQRAAAWQVAVAKLSVEFEAAQGGGYPEELKGYLPHERLRLLKTLGFRVVRRFTVEGEAWVEISGKICVNLKDGFVGRRADP